ncbi:uncharacterized protein B0H18DRAFT_959748 [Fomitopsis serialis]|uniref:uncharacterized protein n=1 Tax=Fomitopsis serialis TaxID=139415 RepID=UPI00200761ED|nr:uncharacterized protein B0H18DRAFT_959748 [Neoantrodia serialis]KAH9914579.1 hypothetical protein B0H18DRAFT_959748 [Neoantrodia serialis]
MNLPTKTTPAEKLTNFLTRVPAPDDDEALRRWLDRFNQELMLYKHSTRKDVRDDHVWKSVDIALANITHRISGELRLWVLENFPELAHEVRSQEDELGLIYAAAFDELSVKRLTNASKRRDTERPTSREARLRQIGQTRSESVTEAAPMDSQVKVDEMLKGSAVPEDSPTKRPDDVEIVSMDGGVTTCDETPASLDVERSGSWRKAEGIHTRPEDNAAQHRGAVIVPIHEHNTAHYDEALERRRCATINEVTNLRRRIAELEAQADVVRAIMAQTGGPFDADLMNYLRDKPVPEQGAALHKWTVDYKDLYDSYFAHRGDHPNEPQPEALVDAAKEAMRLVHARATPGFKLWLTEQFQTPSVLDTRAGTPKRAPPQEGDGKADVNRLGLPAMPVITVPDGTPAKFGPPGKKVRRNAPSATPGRPGPAVSTMHTKRKANELDEGHTESSNGADRSCGNCVALPADTVCHVEPGAPACRQCLDRGLKCDRTGHVRPSVNVGDSATGPIKRVRLEQDEPRSPGRHIDLPVKEPTVPSSTNAAATSATTDATNGGEETQTGNGTAAGSVPAPQEGVAPTEEDQLLASPVERNVPELRHVAGEQDMESADVATDLDGVEALISTEVKAGASSAPRMSVATQTQSTSPSCMSPVGSREIGGERVDVYSARRLYLVAAEELRSIEARIQVLQMQEENMKRALATMERQFATPGPAEDSAGGASPPAAVGRVERGPSRRVAQRSKPDRNTEWDQVPRGLLGVMIEVAPTLDVGMIVTVLRLGSANQPCIMVSDDEYEEGPEVNMRAQGTTTGFDWNDDMSSIVEDDERGHYEPQDIWRDNDSFDDDARSSSTNPTEPRAARVSTEEQEENHSRDELDDSEEVDDVRSNRGDDVLEDPALSADTYAPTIGIDVSQLARIMRDNGRVCDHCRGAQDDTAPCCFKNKSDVACWNCVRNQCECKFQGLPLVPKLRYFEAPLGHPGSFADHSAGARTKADNPPVLMADGTVAATSRDPMSGMETGMQRMNFRATSSKRARRNSPVSAEPVKRPRYEHPGPDPHDGAPTVPGSREVSNAKRAFTKPDRLAGLLSTRRASSRSDEPTPESTLRIPTDYAHSDEATTMAPRKTTATTEPATAPPPPHVAHLRNVFKAIELKAFEDGSERTQLEGLRMLRDAFIQYGAREELYVGEDGWKTKSDKENAAKVVKGISKMLVGSNVPIKPKVAAWIAANWPNLVTPANPLPVGPRRFEFDETDIDSLKELLAQLTQRGLDVFRDVYVAHSKEDRPGKARKQASKDEVQLVVTGRVHQPVEDVNRRSVAKKKGVSAAKGKTDHIKGSREENAEHARERLRAGAKCDYCKSAVNVARPCVVLQGNAKCEECKKRRKGCFFDDRSLSGYVSKLKEQTGGARGGDNADVEHVETTPGPSRDERSQSAAGTAGPKRGVNSKGKHRAHFVDGPGEALSDSASETTKAPSRRVRQVEVYIPPVNIDRASYRPVEELPWESQWEAGSEDGSDSSRCSIESRYTPSDVAPEVEMNQAHREDANELVALRERVAQHREALAAATSLVEAKERFKAHLEERIAGAEADRAQAAARLEALSSMSIGGMVKDNSTATFLIHCALPMSRTASRVDDDEAVLSSIEVWFSVAEKQDLRVASMAMQVVQTLHGLMVKHGERHNNASGIMAEPTWITLRLNKLAQLVKTGSFHVDGRKWVQSHWPELLEGGESRWPACRTRNAADADAEVDDEMDGNQDGSEDGENDGGFIGDGQDELSADGGEEEASEEDETMVDEHESPPPASQPRTTNRPANPARSAKEGIKKKAELYRKALKKCDYCRSATRAVRECTVENGTLTCSTCKTAGKGCYFNGYSLNGTLSKNKQGDHESALVQQDRPVDRSSRPLPRATRSTRTAAVPKAEAAETTVTKASLTTPVKGLPAKHERTDSKDGAPLRKRTKREIVRNVGDGDRRSLRSLTSASTNVSKAGGGEQMPRVPSATDTELSAFDNLTCEDVAPSDVRIDVTASNGETRPTQADQIKRLKKLIGMFEEQQSDMIEDMAKLQADHDWLSEEISFNRTLLKDLQQPCKPEPGPSRLDPEAGPSRLPASGVASGSRRRAARGRGGSNKSRGR